MSLCSVSSTVGIMRLIDGWGGGGLRLADILLLGERAQLFFFSLSHALDQTGRISWRFLASPATAVGRIRPRHCCFVGD